MKKLAIVAVVVLGLLTVHVSTASAKDLSGRFGVGADSTFGWQGPAGVDPMGGGVTGVANVGGPGLSLVYYVSKMFGIQLLANATIVTASDDGADYSFNTFGIGVRGIIPIAFTNDVNLGAVVGFAFNGLTGSITPDGGDSVDFSDNYISIDVGIRPEWFITEHFSVHTQIGLGFSILGENDTGTPFADQSGGGGVTINIFDNADLFGSAGWTFWF